MVNQPSERQERRKQRTRSQILDAAVDGLSDVEFAAALVLRTRCPGDFPYRLDVVNPCSRCSTDLV